MVDVLHICLDDWDLQEVLNDKNGVNDPPFMPNLKSLIVDQGLFFTNCYAQISLCAPSRATQLTGMCGHNTGVTDNDPPDGGYEKYQLLEDNALPLWLQAEGYEVWHVGKFMNHLCDDDPLAQPPGYDEWFVGPTDPEFLYTDFDINENGTIVSYSGSAPEDYLTTVETNQMVNLILTSAAANRAMFWWPLAPHSPADPHPDDLGDFDGIAMPLSPNFNEADVSDKPGYVRNRGFANPNKQQQRWEERRECLKSIDRGVLAIWNALVAVGKEDSTVIIVMSDNGYTQGAHRLTGKENHYEEGSLVPLIIRGPGVDAGATCSKLVWNVDITPTICEITGATAGRTQDGKSLVPLFTDQNPSNWRTALGIFCTPDDGFDVKSIRSDEWELAEWTSATYGAETEGYNMVSDPYQLESIANETAYSAVVAELSADLQTLKACVGAQCWITTVYTAAFDAPHVGTVQRVLLTTGSPKGFEEVEVVV